MGGAVLITIAALVMLKCSVNAQQYTVSTVYQTDAGGGVQATECTSINQVLLGLVSTTAITQVNSADALSTAAGTAFEFLSTAVTTPITSLTAKQNCLEFCRQYAACTAIRYQAGCNGGTGTCVYITTAGPLTVNSRGATSTASCGTSTSGSSVYVKYCSDRAAPTISSSTTTPTNPGTNTPTTATNTWYQWAPWTACVKKDPTGENKTRRRFCNGVACACPAGGSCTTSGGNQYQEETASCTTSCTDSLQVYSSYCSLQYAKEGEGHVWNQCNPRKYKFCQRAQGVWIVTDRDCADGTIYQYDSASTTGTCVTAASDEIGSYTPTLATATPCSRYEVTNDIRQYELNGVTQTCASGMVFWNTPKCACVPGPGVNIAKQYIKSFLCDGTPYNAGGYTGSANPYPDGRQIQYTTAGSTTVNSMCNLVGASNTQAGGIQIPSLKGIGTVLNPTVTMWFQAPGATTTNKQVLITNRAPGFAFRAPLNPNIELYIQSNQLYLVSSNLGTTPVPIITSLSSNSWYCVGVVFDHGTTNLDDVKTTPLTIRVYLKQKGGSLTTPVTRTATSNTVTMNNEVMKVGYSGSGTGTNVEEFFTGLVDSITYIHTQLVTQAMMDQICAVAPDSYN